MNDLRGMLYRVYYESLNRTSLKKLMDSLFLSDSFLGQIRFSEWRKSKRPLFIKIDDGKKEIFEKLLTEKTKDTVLRQSERAVKGKIICFSSWEGDYGNPIDWHRNPRRNVSWPEDVHWSRIMKYEKSCGDVKPSWEINRFPHIYTLVRAYLLTGDSRWVHAFCNQLKSWEEQNPYGYGVNWNSGQELAIRVLAWIFALYAFGKTQAFKEDDFFRIQRLFYLHARHIEKNINFVRYCVPNNHLIGEALGLYAVGALFPWFDKAERWENRGKELLEGECLKQFYKDGGYCQSSHNYHRLALHYYIWALRIGECLGEPFSERIYKIIAKSGEYLVSFMNLKDGRLPNWGANDGALLSPWAGCNHSDFRPLLTAIRYLTIKKKAFPSGPWDEELFWFFGKEALGTSIDPYEVSSRSLSVSGLHVLREGPSDFTVFRCGSVIHRFGHADQLHVDIWWRGLNIAQDGGSYLYNDELAYHRYFMGTKSHNAVTVDDKDQMVLKRRFTWIYKTKAKLQRFSKERIQEASGEHYGYSRLKAKVVHRRKLVSLGEGIFLIIDNLILKRIHKHRYELHWLLMDAPHRIVDNENIKKLILSTSKGEYSIICGCFNKEGMLFNNAQFNIFTGKEGGKPNGWISRYYGLKNEALSLRLSVGSSSDVGFFSLFSPVERKIEVSVEKNNLVMFDKEKRLFKLWE